MAEESMEQVGDVNETIRSDLSSTPEAKLLFEKNSEDAANFKEEGNSLFRAGDHDGALEMYSKAIDYCPEAETIALVS